MFYVLSAKLAKEASPRFAFETGWLVLSSRACVIYRMKRKRDAESAAQRNRDRAPVLGYGRAVMQNHLASVITILTAGLVGVGPFVLLWALSP